MSADIVTPATALLERPTMRRDPLEMTCAELRGLRESLGLTVRALAEGIGQDESTVYRWESGAQRISAGNARSLAALVDYTDRRVEDLVAAHRPGAPIVTYPSDRADRGSGPGRVLSAQWHRVVARRAAERTGARVVWPGQPS